MDLIRLIYFSEMRIDRTEGAFTRHLNAILDVAESRNKAADITGCLLFDDRWFVQTLEGPADHVRDVYQSITRDIRHTNVTLVDLKRVHDRHFGGWWMRCVHRNPDLTDAKRPHVLTDDFSPSNMSGDLLLSLMTGHRNPWHRRSASA